MLHTAAEGETATKDNKEGVRVLGRVFLEINSVVNPRLLPPD